MRATILIAAAVTSVVVAGCGNTPTCQSGEMLATVSLQDNTKNADMLYVYVKIDGGMATVTPLPHSPGQDQGTITVTFPNGYPAGRQVQVIVAAEQQATVLGSGDAFLNQLPDGCTNSAITVLPTCAGTTPAPDIVTRFDDFSGTTFPLGGVYAYSTDASGGDLLVGANPTIGRLQISGAVSQFVPNTTRNEYAGIGMSLNHCIDATGFTGVRFTLGGTAPGCALSFGAKFASDDPPVYDPTRGSCNNVTFSDGGCFGPLAPITLGTMPISVPFSAMTNGNPQQGITIADQAQIIGFSWQMIATTSTPCQVNVTVDDLSFYH